jgi:hypothetical protein
MRPPFYRWIVSSPTSERTTMALTQPECPPAGAEAAIRLLRLRDTFARDELEALLTAGLDAGIVTMVVRDLISIGVIAQEGDNARLSPTAAAQPSNPAAIRDCLFSAVDVSTLWDNDEKGRLPLEGGRDLVRAIAWFCSLPVPDGPYEYKADVAERQQRELGVEVIATPERWLPFARWAAYLGFVRFDAGGGITPDVTHSVAETLAGARQASLDSDALLAIVARRLPVLEGGVFAADVAGRVRDRGRVRTDDADVSSALAYSLLTLRERGLIELELSTGDSRKGRLPDGLGAFSHVTWNGAS